MSVYKVIRAPFVSEPPIDVIIIGGGIHGCSAALFLAQESARVVVLDKDFSGRHASGVNAGGVRRLGRDVREIALAVQSLKIWQSMPELVDDDCGFAASGHVMVAESDAEMAKLSDRFRQLAALGFDHEVLVDRHELRQIVPAVAAHAVGGLYVAGDGAAMPYQATQAIRRKALQLGVEFRDGTEVVKLRRDQNAWHVETRDHQTLSASFLVNCAGAWAGKLCEIVGETAPVIPTAPMLSITAAMPHFITPVASAAGRVLSFKQYGNCTVMIGGGLTGHVDLARNRAELDFAKLAINARTALELFPVMERARIVRSWAGIEARMPDDIPVLGPSPKNENFVHSFGYSAHGFQLGPAAGRVVADLVLGRKTDIDVAALSIQRFGRAAEDRPAAH